MADGREFAWAKVYCDLPRDPKLTVRCPLDRWLYTVLILLARENGAEPGTVPPDQARPRWLASYTGHTLKGVTAALCYFENKGMIATAGDGRLRLLNFDKRQDASDKTVGDRVRRWREKRRNGNGENDRYTTVTGYESNAVEDRRQRTDQHLRTSSSGVATTTAATRAERSLAKDLPTPEVTFEAVRDEYLTQEMVEWAKALPAGFSALELEAVTEEVELYWRQRQYARKTLREWRHVWEQAVLRKMEQAGRRIAARAGS